MFIVADLVSLRFKHFNFHKSTTFSSYIVITATQASSLDGIVPDCKPRRQVCLIAIIANSLLATWNVFFYRIDVLYFSTM